MRTTLIVVIVGLAGVGAGAALGHERGVQESPFKNQMPPMGGPSVPGMPSGMMGMMPSMMAMESMIGGSVAVSPDRTVYVLRAGRLYRYSPELKLLGELQLAPMGPNAAPAHR